MKKNNKGFTLIELLAALVILGLLVMLGLPRLTDAITTSKDKVYVSDAKRLIAQTEYKVKVNNSVVEMPSTYSCIVVGLKYLDASDFDSPPNDGEYLEEQSFTVIKSLSNDEYEYSARLVEAFKNDKGYKGIQLSRSSDLDKKGGLGCVKAFTEDDVSTDIVSMDENTIKQYINDSFGTDYCPSVEKVYRELDLEDSSAGQSNGTPKITSATLTSTGSFKDFNSFQAQLKVRADDDGGRDKLFVCTSTESYYEASSNCQKYNRFANENGVFTYDYDFSAGRSYADDNPPVNIYIIVKDSAGSYSRRQLSYEFHKNEAPVIDKENTSITSKAGDSYNGVNTVITLNVSDDITDVGNLDVCFDEDDGGACNYAHNYKKYSEYFGSGNRFDYTLNNHTLDGSTHVVVVHVKDQYGVEAEPYSLAYTLYESPAPEFQGNGTDGSHITITPVKYLNVIEQSLQIKVSFTLLDKLGDVNTSDIAVRIGLLDENDAVFNEQEYVYRKNKQYVYLIKDKWGNSEYNGQTVKLRVSVFKKPYGTGPINSEIIDYTVHKNTPPGVSFTNVYSTGFDACVPGFRCDAYGRHSKDIYYSFHVEDDTSKKSELLYCISEYIDDCKRYPVNYKHFDSDSFDNDYSFDISGIYEFHPKDSVLRYMGEDKDLFVFVRDTRGNTYNTHIDGGYQLYTNKPPYIDILEVIDGGASGVDLGSMNIKISPKLYNNDYIMYTVHDHNGNSYVADDLTENKYIAYELKLDDIVLNTSPYSDQKFSLSLEEIEERKRLEAAGNTHAWDDVTTFDQILNTESVVHLTGIPYDGRTLHFKLTLTDSYGESSEFTAEHTLYNNKPPTIERFDIVSSDPPCEECEGGGYSVKVRLSASDDLDPSSNLYVCINESLEYCQSSSEYISYSDFFEGKDYTYTLVGGDSLNAYLGQTKHLYVAVRDHNDARSYSETTHTVYENKGPTYGETFTVESQNSKFNSLAAVFNSTATDDLGNLYQSICYGEVGADGDSPSDYKCTAYKPYDEHFKFKIDAYSYSKQKYYIYAKLKDSYDVEVVSPIVEYTVANDSKPVIDSVSGKYGVPNHNGEGIIVFKGHDYGDSYDVCIKTTNNSSGCTYSAISYDGSSSEEFTYTYTFGSNPQNTTTTYYMFARDKSGKVSDAKSFKFTQYSSSSGTCETGEDFRSVTYTPRSSNNYMNSDTCAGRCYYWTEEKEGNKVVKEASDTVNILVPYTKKIAYLDKFNLSNKCSESSSAISLTCGSVECFNTGTLTNKKYSGNKVIGLEERISTETWTYCDEMAHCLEIEAGESYYSVYETDYNEGDEFITLNPTPYIIPVETIDDYKYGPETSTKYLRALDSDDVKINRPTSDMVSAKIKVVNPKNAGTITIGDKVQIGPYSFHVVKTTSSETVLLQDYNLHYGSYISEDETFDIDPTNYTIYANSSSAICMQDPDAVGWRSDSHIRKGTVDFTSGYSYWSGIVNSYPSYVYSIAEDKACHSPVEKQLDELNVHYNQVRFMSYDEATNIGCRLNASTCPSWASTGTYWLGTAYNPDYIYIILSDGRVTTRKYDGGFDVGLRYVVTVNTNEVYIG